MSLAAVRTSAVAILTVAVALRVGLSQPPAGMLTTIAGDPGGSLAATTSGWTTAGTLGSATAQGVRDVPVALFVWLGDALALSTQAVQAFWYVLVTLLALLGALRLARTTAQATDPVDAAAPTSTSWAPHVAAVVYACGPALLATLSRSPSDGLVAATLPWIVAPLLTGAVGWRPAAASAAWLGLAGIGSPHWAVAAVVTGLVAAAPMLRGRRVQLVRWLLLACLASAWWVAVLLWEAAHTIDVSAQLPETGVMALARDAFGGSSWGTGWFVMAVLASAAVAGAALLLRAGRRSEPLVAGLVLVSVAATAAHLIGVDVPVSAASAAGGAPNVLAPVLSWVAVAGLASWAPLFETLRERLRVRALVPRNLVQAVALGVAAVAVPASFLGFVLAAHERTEPATGLWEQVSQWSAQAPPGRVLVLPAVDGLLEPAVAKALGGRPWVARDSVPLSGARATSALDDAVWRLSRGMGGPGTAAALERLGVAYVIVRNDLPVEADRTRPAALLRHALTVQGASRTAVFSGPAPVRSWLPVGTVTDFGVRSATPSLEVWSTGQGSAARLYNEEPLVVAGDPGTATDLVDAGLAGAPVTIAPPDTSEIDLVSDSPRRRDVDQGEAVEPYGPYLTASDDVDVHPPGAAPEPTSTRRLVGVRSVDASSSAADLGARPPRPGSDPVASLDGNPYTAWQSASADPGEWWEVEFLGPTDLSAAELQLAQNPFAGAVVTRLRLEYDGGATEVDVPPNGVVGLTPATVTTRLRVVATEFAGDRPTAGFGIAELSVGQLSVRDELVVATPPGARTWLFAARTGSRANCVPAAPEGSDAVPAEESSVACNAGMAVTGPDRGVIHRLVEAEETVEVRGRVWMRSTNSNQTGDLADQSADPSIVVAGSSVATPDLVGRPQAAADDDVTTSWRPAPDDLQPIMTLRWDEAARVTGLRLLTAAGDPASTPTRVRVQSGAEDELTWEAGQDVDVRPDGTVSFDPVRTDQLMVTVLEDSGDVSLDTLTAGLRQLPIAIAETEVLGGPTVTYDGERIESLPCGTGPSVEVGQRRFDTSVIVSADELVRGTVVSASVCGRPDVARGTTRVTVRESFRWTPLGLALSPADGPLGRIDEMSSSDGPQPLPMATVGTTGSEILDLPEADRDGTLVVAVPAGEGWTARAGGELLPPVTVERWAQGWLVPAGTNQVRLDYSPAGSLRWAAGAGLTGWVVVLAVAALAARGWKRRRDQAIAGRSTQS